MPKTPLSSRVEKTKTGLAFFGVIDSQSIPALLEAMPKTDSPEMELDLRAATRVDSAGLAFLIYWGNRNLAPDQKISLRGASVQVLQLINIMNLKSVFELRA
jgi:ABC-type transporter Mla MlaB component